MANKIYKLTIEYDEANDDIEYIQEEIIDQGEMQESTVLCELIEEDYWDKDTLSIIKQFYLGEIGES